MEGWVLITIRFADLVRWIHIYWKPTLRYVLLYYYGTNASSSFVWLAINWVKQIANNYVVGSFSSVFASARI